MVVSVYVSGISGNKEVKKRQQRVVMILESKSIEYATIDITEPGKEMEKEFMQQNSKLRDSKHPLPPQLFNGVEYCGDYEEFDMANEMDELEKFLKLSGAATAEPKVIKPPGAAAENGHVANGTTSSRENSAEKETGDQRVPESQEEHRRSETTESKATPYDTPVNEAVNSEEGWKVELNDEGLVDDKTDKEE